MESENCKKYEKSLMTGIRIEVNSKMYRSEIQNQARFMKVNNGYKFSKEESSNPQNFLYKSFGNSIVSKLRGKNYDIGHVYK